MPDSIQSRGLLGHVTIRYQKDGVRGQGACICHTHHGGVVREEVEGVERLPQVRAAHGGRAVLKGKTKIGGQHGVR